MRINNTDFVSLVSQVFERSMTLDPIDKVDALDKWVFNFPDDEMPIATRMASEDSTRLSRRAKLQLTARLGMPEKVLDRLSPGLRFAAINHLIQQYEQNQMMTFRTVDKGDDKRVVRALVTERYTPLDDVDVVPLVADVLADTDAEVLRADFDDDYTHLRVVFPRTQTEVKKGDIIRTGISISNSEVGLRSLLFNPFNERLVCLNGMTSTESQGTTSLRHVGNAARLKDSVWRAVEDARVGAVRMQEQFKKALDHAVLDPIKAINDHGTSLLTQDQLKAVLAAYTVEPDPTLFGVINAFTRGAQMMGDMETQYEVERVGARLLAAA